MPYIEKKRRAEITGLGELPETAGELNYKLTKVVLQYLETKGEKYQTYNDIMGALDGCARELYRRKVSKYEDEKIAQNGDVY